MNVTTARTKAFMLKIKSAASNRTFMHALIFIVLAVIVGSVGWIVGTGARAFMDIAVPKLTLL